MIRAAANGAASLRCKPRASGDDPGALLPDVEHGP